MSEQIARHTPIRRWAERWLLKGYRPETCITLGQRRIYVLPTAAGVAFAAMLLVLLIASINYSLSLGYAFTFLLGGIGLASAVHAFRNLLHLTIHTGRVASAFCGESALFSVIVHNARQARRPALRLRAGESMTAFDALPGGDTVVELARPAMHRGWFPMGRTMLETTWPLGLFRAWSVLIPDERCLVFPAPEANPPPLPLPSMGGEHGTRSGGDGDDDFAGLRPYDEADSPKHVAWKVFARGGPMLTKQFSGYDGADLLLDWAALPPMQDDEARLSRLTAWVLMADQAGTLFALNLPTAEAPPGRGAAHTQLCLRLLALHGQESGEAEHV